MKILLWAPFGAGTHYWGPGTSAFRLYRNLAEVGIEVTLVHGTNCQDMFPDVYARQIKIGNLDNQSKIAFIKYLIKSFIWIKNNHQNYDVFHGITAFFYSFIPAIFFNRYNKNTYLKITGSRGGFQNNGLLSRISGFSKFRLKRANQLGGYISVSSNITENLIANGISRDKIFYIPNGVDIKRFHPLNEYDKSILRKLNQIDNVFTLCYIGGLTSNKRVLQVVEAVAMLVKLKYKVQFIIVGPDRSGGIVENEIQNYIDRNSISSNCIRIDHTDEPELYYKLSDVFVLNSEFEGLSNSLLEAMASGLPCVATPVSGTIDVIEDKVTGYISDGTPGQIAEIIKFLYENRAIYNEVSRKARRQIEKSFDTRIVLDQHIKLFQNH